MQDAVPQLRSWLVRELAEEQLQKAVWVGFKPKLRVVKEDDYESLGDAVTNAPKRCLYQV